MASRWRTLVSLARVCVNADGFQTAVDMFRGNWRRVRRYEEEDIYTLQQKERGNATDARLELIVSVL